MWPLFCQNITNPRILIPILLIIILIERSRHTFRPFRQFLDILDPRQKNLGLYFIEVSPILIYVAFLLVSAIFYGIANVRMPNTTVQETGIVFFFGGMLIRTWSIKTLGNKWTVFVVPKHGCDIVTDIGPYRYVRHPYYMGSWVEFVGLATFLWGISVAILLASAQAFAYTLRALREERVLEQLFDKRYQSYKGRVPAFCPRPKSLLRNNG